MWLGAREAARDCSLQRKLPRDKPGAFGLAAKHVAGTSPGALASYVKYPRGEPGAFGLLRNTSTGQARGVVSL